MIGADRPSNAPAVTIGMPVYNGMPFVETALQALARQSYQEFVLLVSDNASTDGTWELLQAWAPRDPRIVLRRQQSNIGLMRNFQYLLDEAKTEYFMWHAHDDWLAPNYLEALLEVIRSEPGCALAVGVVERMMRDGTPEKKHLFPALDGLSRIRRIRRLLWAAQPGWYYGLFRTEELRSARRIEQEFGYVWAADRLLLLRYILNDAIRGTNRVVLYSTKSPASKARYWPATLAGRLRFFTKYLRLHFRVLGASDLSPWKKVLCLPPLVIHAFRTKGMLKLKYLIDSVQRRVKGRQRPRDAR